MRNSGSTVGRIVEITLGSRWIHVGIALDSRWIRVGFALDLR